MMRANGHASDLIDPLKRTASPVQHDEAQQNG